VHSDEAEKEENDTYGDKDLEEMGEESEVTPELIRRKVQELNERLKKLKEQTPNAAAKRTTGTWTHDGSGSVIVSPRTSPICCCRREGTLSWAAG
jgi:hypothetical protein